NTASPTTTCPSIIMITAASSAAGTAASSTSASTVTAITTLADLPGVGSECQPVITLTSLARSTSGPWPPRHQHDISCPLVVNAYLDRHVQATGRLAAARSRCPTGPAAIMGYHLEARMTDMLIRDVPDDVIAAVDARASRLGLSRSEYVRRRLAQDA